MLPGAHCIAMLAVCLCVLCIFPHVRSDVDQWKLMRGTTFNADSIQCIGQRYTFQCRYDLGLVNGSVEITKYPAEWNYDEAFVANALGMDYRPGLSPSNMPEHIRQQAVRVATGTMNPVISNGSVFSEFTWELPQLTLTDSGVYCCRIKTDNPRIAPAVRYSRLQVNVCWSVYSSVWLPLAVLIAIGICLFCVFACWLKRTNKPKIRRLIIVSHPDESSRSNYQSFDSKPGTWSTFSLPCESDLTETSLLTPSSTEETSSNPVTQPLVRFETVYTNGSLGVRIRSALRRLGPKHRKSKGEQTPPPGCLVLPAEDEECEAGLTKFTETDTGTKAQALTVVNNRFANMYCLAPDRNYELPRENLKIGSFLGGGAFGVVYNGVAKDLPGRPPGSHLVAVKTLRDNFVESDVVDLLKEMDIMKQLHHNKHIIQLLAVCTQKGAPCLVLEYAAHGNLRDYLRAQKYVLQRSDSTVALLLNYGSQVAEGMTYLSSRSIIHRDLAARNILVGENSVLKISDFGLTRNVVDYYRKTTNGRLPIKWLAPESIFERIYTTKSDVWSFGVLLWEIFTFGSPPFQNVDPATIPSLIRSGVRNPRPKFAPEEVYSLMCACWEWDPKQRPSFARLHLQLVRFEQTMRTRRCDDDDGSIDSNNLSPVSSLSAFWDSLQHVTKLTSRLESSTTDGSDQPQQPYSDLDSVCSAVGVGGAGKSDVTQYLEVHPSNQSDNLRVSTLKPITECVDRLTPTMNLVAPTC